MTSELILANGRFVMDGDRPDIGAVAVAGERIVGLGTIEEAKATVSGQAGMVDLGGATVFPGFSDNHIHALNLGRSRMGVPCWPTDVESVTQIVELVRQADATTAPGQWIKGRGYDPTKLAEGRAPTADELELDSGRPVMLDSFDFHRRVANRSALRAAGIGPDTVDPADGEILRDSDGTPTGELVDGARAILDSVVSPWTPEEDERAVQIATDRFLALGFTYVTNAAPLTMSHRGEEVAAFLRLSQRGELRLRFSSMIRAELLEHVAAAGLRPGIGGDRFRLGGAKVFADGALGTRTAYLTEPYADGDQSGSLRLEQEQLESFVRAGRDAGWQVCVHAQGDRAIALTAGIMARYRLGHGSLSHRIEHCCITAPSTVQMMASASIIPVPQLGFLRYRAPDFAAGLGERRVAGMYPLRSWIDAGLKPIHSSDSPVIADPRPLVAVATAIGRADADGNVWGPEEGITFEEAISMMTSWSAEAEGLGQERGRIAVGYLADFTAFADDPRRLGTDELVEVGPSMTIVGGTVAWAAE